MKTIEYECSQDDFTYTIKIGENAQDNWDIISESNQNDIWFHVENHPSCHVIILTNNRKKIHKSVINHAASLCKEGCKLNSVKKLKIIYTEIKNIRKADKVGSVYTKNTKEINRINRKIKIIIVIIITRMRKNPRTTTKKKEQR